MVSNKVSKLNQLEFARTVGIHGLNDTMIKIKIPRLMVNIPRETERIIFDRNIFVNAPDCKILSSNTIETQNFITVPKTANCDLTHIAVWDEELGKYIIPDNSSIICACFYNDLIYVIDSYK